MNTQALSTTTGNAFLAQLFSLAGRVALVTGGGTGLGNYMAQALHRAGAKVVLVGRDLPRLQQGAEEVLAASEQNTPPHAADTSVACVAWDVSQLDTLPHLVKEAARPFGMPDILINAAGLNPRRSWDAVDPALWEYVLRLNLSAPFFLAKALIPSMQDKGWGRIINVASLQASRAFVNGAPYGASKGGVAQLTRAMAEAWSCPESAITANAIAPGFFKTSLTATLFNDPKTVQALEKQTMFHRIGLAQDIQGLTVFLAAPASDYLTGQVIYLDGGWSAK
ncbi:MAG: SDR family oxidoreductase [Desulfovibrionaceae bacterium]